MSRWCRLPVATTDPLSTSPIVDLNGPVGSDQSPKALGFVCCRIISDKSFLSITLSIWIFEITDLDGLMSREGRQKNAGESNCLLFSVGVAEFHVRLACRSPQSSMSSIDEQSPLRNREFPDPAKKSCSFCLFYTLSLCSCSFMKLKHSLVEAYVKGVNRKPRSLCNVFSSRGPRLPR